MEKEHALKESLDAHDGRRGRRTPVRRDGYDGGSLAEVTTALDALRLYLHPEADSTLMNATVTYTVDGQANELALSPAASDGEDGEPTAYEATIPIGTTNVRLVAPNSPAASVSVDGRSVNPAAGTGIAFDAREGAAPVQVVISSKDGTSETTYTMTVASDYAGEEPTDPTDPTEEPTDPTDGPTDPAEETTDPSAATDAGDGAAAGGDNSGSNGGDLATTGADLQVLAVLGAVLIAAGAAGLAMRRRRA